MRTSTLIYVEVMLLYDTTALLQTFFCCGLEEEGEIPTILFAVTDFLGLWHQPSITLTYITPLPIDPDIIHVCWVHLKISIF